MRTFPFVSALTLTIALTAPATARADIFLTPYAGLSFGNKIGDANVECESEPCSLPKRAVLGGALAVIGGSGLGIEADLGFIQNFFAPKDFDPDILGTNHVTTVMGNLLFAVGSGGIRPYVTGGAGLIRSQLGEFGELFDATDSTFGVNVGAGLFLGSGRLRLRGDARYFRSMTESDEVLIAESMQDLRFWRATAGLVIRF